MGLTQTLVLKPATALLLLALATAAVAEQSVPLRTSIDNRIAAAWGEQKIVPAGPSTDAEFLRRVFLDLVGTIPSYDETTAFFNDISADKRARLIDRLLDDPRFAQHQADVWDQVLFGRNPPGFGTNTREGFQNWLKKQFAENVPYDQWARAILKAEGNTADDGPAMWYVQYNRKPEDATEALTQKFLGVQLQCARCHDHPFEEWTQLDFYGMAAFLARLQVVTVGKKGRVSNFMIGETSTGDVLFTGPASEQEAGKKGEPVKPKFLLGDPLEEPELPEDFKEIKFENNKPPPAPVFSRKDQLADWIATADNRFFVRAVANRVWAQFMGRGLVHPVDNMSPASKPSHPELLDDLEAGLIENQFDLKWLTRELCNSKVYQLSGSSEIADAKPQWFERARMRPLSAEELIDAWRVANDYDNSSSAKRNAERQKNDRFRPLGSGYLLRFFGRPSTGTGDFQGGLQEHLYLNNGPLSSVITAGEGSLYDSLLNSEDGWERRIDRLYLSILNRPPDDDERAKFVDYLSTDEKPNDRLREAIWVLMSCSEFRFNH